MDSNQLKKIKQLEEAFGSKMEILYDGVLDGFAYYFSRLDTDGLDKLLIDYKRYDGASKEQYLKLFKETFNTLKSKDITGLEVFPGVCNGCINKGCSGFSFVDNKTGLYIDIMIDVKDKEINNFMECYDFKNEKQKLNKKERIVIK